MRSSRPYAVIWVAVDGAAEGVPARRAPGGGVRRAAGRGDPARAVFSYANGYATMELSSFCLDCGPSGERADFDTILALSRTPPADLPSDLAQVARVVCLGTDLDQQFEFGLQALLAGLEA